MSKKDKYKKSQELLDREKSIEDWSDKHLDNGDGPFGKSWTFWTIIVILTIVIKSIWPDFPWG
jgi:hypothetical protein